jgi:hypothetical protein
MNATTILTLETLPRESRVFELSAFTPPGGPLTLLGSEYPQAVQELNKAIDRAEGLLITNLSLGKMPLR